MEGEAHVRKRQRVKPTDDWQEILPLCWWPEQVEYERIRHPVLFGSPVGERPRRPLPAVQEYGPPEAFVTDSGSVFLANRARVVYRALGIRKVEIEKGQPWQSYLETTWNVQRRMADQHFAKAEGWPELLAEHDRWVRDYNLQEHYAHRHRKQGRRSPSEVLIWVKTPRFQEEDLARAFFSARHTRTVDDLGYLIL
jgi:hypothetical protein